MSRRPPVSRLLCFLCLDDRPTLVRALLLALDLDPALALALVLAGAGLLAVGGGAGPGTLAGVDARALHCTLVPLALVAGELVAGGQHPDHGRRYSKPHCLLGHVHLDPPSRNDVTVSTDPRAVPGTPLRCRGILLRMRAAGKWPGQRHVFRGQDAGCRMTVTND